MLFGASCGFFIFPFSFDLLDLCMPHRIGEEEEMWKPSFLKFKFGRTFWSAIVTEIHERGAWYGLFSLIALYLTGPTQEGALGLTHEQKGQILGVVPFFVYIVPLISGTVGDKIGYKKVLLTSFVVLSLGYFSMSLADSYYSFFGFFMLTALGAGIFKPMISGTIARVTRGDDKKTSVGFALFYMMVNLGGFFGPIIAGMFRPSIAADGTIEGSWKYVFYLSAFYMVLMFFWTLFTYEEPEKDDDHHEVPLLEKLKQMVTDLKDVKLTALLIIFVGFWAMFMQLFITLPSWIDEWVNTSSLASFIPFDSWVSHGQLKAEYIINLDAAAIILFNVVVATMVARFNVIKVISYGILLSAFALFGLSFSADQSGGSFAPVMMLLMIFVFAVGEMMSSPKFTELMGRIAPKEKIGTYQAYGFLSVAFGSLFGGWLSGLYGTFADKTAAYKQLLLGEYGFTEKALEGKGVHEFADMLTNEGANVSQISQELWESNAPYTIWIIYGMIGVATVVALVIYRSFVPDIAKQNDTP